MSDDRKIICTDDNDEFLCSVKERGNDLELISYTGDKYVLPYERFDPGDKQLISDIWVIISGKYTNQLFGQVTGLF